MNERLLKRTKEAAQKLVPAFEQAGCVNVTTADPVDGVVRIFANGRNYIIAEDVSGRGGTWLLKSEEYPHVWESVYLPSTHTTPSPRALSTIEFLLRNEANVMAAGVEQQKRATIVEEVKKMVEGKGVKAEASTNYDGWVKGGHAIGKSMSFTIIVPIEQAPEMAGKLVLVTSPS